MGDTVEGEALEPPGDVDEFTFEGIAGQEVAVFFQALDATLATFEDDLELLVLLDAGTSDETQLARVASDGGDPTLEDQTTGPIALPQTGTYTLRIQGLDSYRDRGPYRFHVREVGGGG